MNNDLIRDLEKVSDALAAADRHFRAEAKRLMRNLETR